MLKANMVGEEEDNCTFKPKINRIKRTDNDDRPVSLCCNMIYYDMRDS